MAKRTRKPQSRDIVVVGASAGGVQVLQELMRGLPADFPGPRRAGKGSDGAS